MPRGLSGKVPPPRALRLGLQQLVFWPTVKCSLKNSVSAGISNTVSSVQVCMPGSCESNACSGLLVFPRLRPHSRLFQLFSLRACLPKFGCSFASASFSHPTTCLGVIVTQGWVQVSVEPIEARECAALQKRSLMDRPTSKRACMCMHALVRCWGCCLFAGALQLAQARETSGTVRQQATCSYSVLFHLSTAYLSFIYLSAVRMEANAALV